MSLWVDKYRPQTLEKLEFHNSLNNRLKKLAQSGDLPHLLFYGPPGGGKKTRIMALLRELYGAPIEKVKVEQRTFQYTEPTKVTVEITVLSSLHHVELSPADAGTRDCLIVQSIVKDFASTNQISDAISKKGFKVIILNEVDRLSKKAQHALRRTMEKSTSGCRIILCANSSGKVIAPIRSRCLLLRVPLPSDDEVKDILFKIAKKQSINLPDELANRIVDYSKRNLRKAILCFESTKVANYPFSLNQTLQTPDWELYIAEIAKDILQEQSPQRLQSVRLKLYELLSHCIPADIILKSLVTQLLPMLDSNLKEEVTHWAAFYENRLQTGSKEIFHLEGFVAKFMSIMLTFYMEIDM